MKTIAGRAAVPRRPNYGQSRSFALPMKECRRGESVPPLGILHGSWVARATRPCRRATGPAEAGMRLLAKALRQNFSPSLSVPLGESPTGTGESPVPPNRSWAGYEISGLGLGLRLGLGLGLRLRGGWQRGVAFGEGEDRLDWWKESRKAGWIRR